MFGVIRRWKLKEDTSVLFQYFRYFKENFKQSLFLGLLWFLFLLLLYVNYSFVLQVQSGLTVFMLVPLLFISLLFVFTTVFFISDDDALSGFLERRAEKFLFFVAMAYFPITLLILVIFVFLALILLYVPVTFLALFSLAAYVNFSLCHYTFQRIEHLKEDSNPFKKKNGSMCTKKEFKGAWEWRTCNSATPLAFPLIFPLLYSGFWLLRVD